MVKNSVIPGVVFVKRNVRFCWRVLVVVGTGRGNRQRSPCVCRVFYPTAVVSLRRIVLPINLGDQYRCMLFRYRLKTHPYMGKVSVSCQDGLNIQFNHDNH